MSKNTDLGSLVNYIKGQVTGRLNAPAYTSATAFTGTITGYLGFDTSGNILTSSAVGLSGSGTTNYISKWTGSTALGNSLIFDNGTNVGINTASPKSYGALTVSGQLIAMNNVCLNVGEAFKFNTYYSAGDKSISTGYAAQISLDNSNGGLAFKSTSGSVAADAAVTIIERMRITASGNLSLGNTNNTYKLDVTGDVNISGTYRVNGTALGSGVTGSGSTNYMPLWTSTTGLGNSIIYNNAGNLGINSTTDGYTLNAIRSASTQFNDVYRGTGGFIQIFARFMQDESTKKGIAIGYSSSFSYAGIFGTQDTSSLRLGILDGSTFKAKLAMTTTTVSMDLPTSGGGLNAGDLYNDGGTVKIV
jgi:hypothetical protein